MPVYTYRCDNCGVQFERTQHFNERQLFRCPECGKKALHRVYRPVGVVFRGSGFYVTDNRSASSSLPARSSKGEGEAKSSEKSGENASGSSDSATSGEK